ncbi:MAG: hypothetical protein Q8P24_08610 [Desulfobacterales bacterium]|nr:hypothetical protein [Desulfobacterales bacterium]
MKRINKGAGPEVIDRKLIYFPIIHTEADMGRLSGLVRRAALQKLGLRGLKNKANLIDKIWTVIEKTIEGLDLSFEKVRLYQDGLPVCGHASGIVADLAAESRNHRLLMRLMDKGAVIMGTESPELLLEEYELAKKILTAGGNLKSMKIEAHQKPVSDSLLKRRDQSIADRINATLCPGETGILFLGMLHSLGHLLDEQIKVIYPITGPFNRWDRMA